MRHATSIAPFPFYLGTRLTLQPGGLKTYEICTRRFTFYFRGFTYWLVNATLLVDSCCYSREIGAKQWNSIVVNWAAHTPVSSPDSARMKWLLLHGAVPHLTPHAHVKTTRRRWVGYPTPSLGPWLTTVMCKTTYTPTLHAKRIPSVIKVIKEVWSEAVSIEWGLYFRFKLKMMENHFWKVNRVKVKFGLETLQ